MLRTKKLLNGNAGYVLVVGLLFLTALSSPGYAATYYIDFDNGNDDNAGSSQALAWKTIPGTRNSADTNWQQTEWGAPGNSVFNSTKKVPKGTVFALKRGTTHDRYNGGKIWINTTYYNSDGDADNPIKFIVVEDWGSGEVTFDGTDINVGGNSRGLIYIAVDGVEFDGRANSAIAMIVRDSAYNGISTQWNLRGLNDISIRYVKLINNGTNITNDSSGASNGQ